MAPSGAELSPRSMVQNGGMHLGQPVGPPVNLAVRIAAVLTRWGMYCGLSGNLAGYVMAINSGTGREVQIASAMILEPCTAGVDKLVLCRSALYDGQILSWIRNDVVQADLAAEDANMAELSRRLLRRYAALS